MLENIVARYDAEHDAGPVTWVDMQLVKAIKQLERDIFQIQQFLDELDEGSLSRFIALQANTHRSDHS